MDQPNGEQSDWSRLNQGKQAEYPENTDPHRCSLGLQSNSASIIGLTDQLSHTKNNQHAGWDYTERI
jgi:hypothetical protein